MKNILYMLLSLTFICFYIKNKYYLKRKKYIIPFVSFVMFFLPLINFFNTELNLEMNLYFKIFNIIIVSILSSFLLIKKINICLSHMDNIYY